MAIFPAKYNGINFSYDFSRESQRYNFDNQRLRNVVNKKNIKTLSFIATNVVDHNSGVLYLISRSFGSTYLQPLLASIEISFGTWLYYYELLEDDFNLNDTMYLSFQVDSSIIYSELFLIKSAQFIAENEICEIKAYNNDARHGYLTSTYPAFGFFKFSKLNSDIFINKKTEYEYSYGRRKILSSENNIGKRFTFLDLTMYQQNLLKWLCNTENLFIDGVKYELISDFTELLADENSEIKDLRADFVESEQSFFATGSNLVPKKQAENFFLNNAPIKNNDNTSYFNDMFDYRLPFKFQ